MNIAENKIVIKNDKFGDYIVFANMIGKGEVEELKMDLTVLKTAFRVMKDDLLVFNVYENVICISNISGLNFIMLRGE